MKPKNEPEVKRLRSVAPRATSADVIQPGLSEAAAFFIVALGASAGGLEALRSFFDAMPPDSGMGFVVIPHLAPEYKSQMSALLGRNTTMPVAEATDGVLVEVNHVYVIPPGKCMTIVQGRLLLTDVTKENGPTLPIDHFFISLAQDRGERAIGIGLSGTGSDGTRGIRAIKEAGGLVVSQDEASAKFSGMPHSAIATGLADYILPPGQMADALLKFIRHPLLVTPPSSVTQPLEGTMAKIISVLRVISGIDFSAYKQNTVARRLLRRMGIAQIHSSEAYHEYLQQAPEEVEALKKDLLILVTRFFRDREAFESLRKKVVPALFASAAEEKSIRVWVAACATGEEVYALAILLREHAVTLAEEYEVKIFATDVSQEALEIASRGIYPMSITADVPEELVARYFRKEAGGYRICRSLRDQVVFARQDLLKDPPFTRMNLVSCRNVLIYLQPEAQRKVLTAFHFALKPGGFLFLGASETVGEHRALEMFDAKARIFQRRPEDVAPGKTSATPAFMAVPRQAPGSEIAPEKRGEDKLWEGVSARLIADYAPTGFVLGEEDQILFSFGEPEKFATLKSGRVRMELLALVPPDLALALSTAIRAARKKDAAVRYHGVKFRRDKKHCLLDLTVEPVAHGGRGQPRALLVLLKETGKAGEKSPAEKFDRAAKLTQRIADLEEDVQAGHQNLQASAERQQMANEELQASNEELIAANEELQSTNEELESVNEELTTLNTEFQQKIDELLVAHNDLDNFLRTSQIGTIFLDASLRIRKFTPLVAEEMNLRPQDTGRPLSDLSHSLIIELSRGAENVLRDHVPVDRTVETKPGVWYLLRISPYRREGASDEGVVASFVNVSALKGAERNFENTSNPDLALAVPQKSNGL